MFLSMYFLSIFVIFLILFCTGHGYTWGGGSCYPLGRWHNGTKMELRALAGDVVDLTVSTSSRHEMLRQHSKAAKTFCKAMKESGWKWIYSLFAPPAMVSSLFWWVASTFRAKPNLLLFIRLPRGPELQAGSPFTVVLCRVFQLLQWAKLDCTTSRLVCHQKFGNAQMSLCHQTQYKKHTMPSQGPTGSYYCFLKLGWSSRVAAPTLKKVNSLCKNTWFIRFGPNSG